MSLDNLYKKSLDLRTNLSVVKTLPSSELLKEEIVKRKRFRTEIRQEKNLQKKMISAYKQDIAALRQNINETEDIIRTMEVEQDWLDTDIMELTDFMWQKIHGEKDVKSGKNATDPEIVGLSSSESL